MKSELVLATIAFDYEILGCVDSLLDTAAWGRGVRSQSAVSLRVSELGHDDNDGCDFGSHSDRWW